MGQPLELEPMPADENARATWWAIKILRQNDVIPEEVQWRKRIELLKCTLAHLREEKHLRDAVEQINRLVFKLNTLGTNALSAGIAPVSLEAELEKFRERYATEEIM
jgi:hypothetical protein